MKALLWRDVSNKLSDETYQFLPCPNFHLTKGENCVFYLCNSLSCVLDS